MAPLTGHRSIELDYPADPRVVQDVRARLDEFVRPCGLEADEIDALKVALSEAFSNAVCHGSPQGPRNRIGVRCELEPERLVIEITDQGGGFRPSQIALPAFEEWKTSGRGLFLMQHLVDDVEFEPIAGGTRVRMIKRLEEPEHEFAHEAAPAAARPHPRLTNAFASVPG
jgi:serine/threonine-protein kinase RsbW